MLRDENIWNMESVCIKLAILSIFYLEYTTFSNDDFIRERDIHSKIYLECMTVHTIMTMNIKISTERWLLPTIACHSCTLCSLSMQNTSDFLWNVASKLGHLWMDDMPGYTKPHVASGD